MASQASPITPKHLRDASAPTTTPTTALHQIAGTPDIFHSPSQPTAVPVAGPIYSFSFSFSFAPVPYALIVTRSKCLGLLTFPPQLRLVHSDASHWMRAFTWSQSSPPPEEIKQRSEMLHIGSGSALAPARSASLRRRDCQPSVK